MKLLFTFLLITSCGAQTKASKDIHQKKIKTFTFEKQKVLIFDLVSQIKSQKDFKHSALKDLDLNYKIKCFNFCHIKRRQ